MQKLYYSITEVSKMLGLASHVFRYWETEFTELKPKKSRAGSRMYRDKDIDLLKEIQKLLHTDRFTIEGARRELPNRLQKENMQIEDKDIKTPAKNSESKLNVPIEEIRKELKEILQLLG
ncbi:MAG: MerR family transcriptional regulator [Candidatus Electryonea clarkiae]|nr:MerR family transcriptional regulator [Candidatus Electryonea clarkiae]MDP8286616.1 MerR family transcriptional regulator [Candidatus Electryonea clarkiae]